MSDGFYTPKNLARDLIGFSRQDNPKHIADFAVGGGSLLAAASEVWPNAKLHGIDIDPAAISETETRLPSIKSYSSDFLSDESLRLTYGLFGAIDLIVLNPPFSCRGSLFEKVFYGDKSVKCSKAMAFILRSCRYLRPGGEILAIVPRSCLFSQKDSHSRKVISDLHTVEDLGIYERPGFLKASVSVHLIRVTKLSDNNSTTATSPNRIEQIRPNHGYSLVFMRGNHSVSDSAVKTRGPSLIHTTDLFNSEISISRRRAVHCTKLVSGPVLMLPRVARPNVEKIAIGTFAKPVVPSDCIICVKTNPPGHEEHLQSQFRVFWRALRDSYSGTCAAYLTMEAFKDFAAKLGFEAKLDSDPQIWNPIGPISDSRKALRTGAKN